MNIGLLLGFIFAIGLFMVFSGFDRNHQSGGQDLDDRLKGYGVTTEVLTLEEQELQVPFKERILDPIVDRLVQFVSSRTPDSSREAIWQKIQLSGSMTMTPSRFMASRFLGGGLGAGLGILLGGLLLHNLIVVIAGIAVGGGLGYYLPMLSLNQKIRKRRGEILSALPDAMDLLTIGVEAGLSFDGAMTRVTDKFHNALSEEFQTVLHETKLGRPRADALEEMGFRSGVEDLHNFVQAIVQSEQMGVGVAKILRLQSEEIRRKRRQRAQEQGAQASLKMLLPMVGCIFPTIWIVLLGPAVIMVTTQPH